MPRKIALIFVLSAMALASAASASPLTINDLTQATTGPFRHNVFHSASGVTSGAILAWFDLDTSQTSTYDPVTGALTININIFNASSLGTQTGTALGVGSGLVGSTLNLDQNTLVGSIDWSFDMSAGGVNGTLNAYLRDNSTAAGSGTSWSITQDFTGVDYVTSALDVPNGWENDKLSLWGADNYNNTTKAFEGQTLGVDMVAAVPEPGTLILTGLGLACASMFKRRRRRS